MSEKPSLREPDVENAVRFLNDSRVKSSTSTRAALFLKRKGLSKEEVEEAFRRAGREAPPTGWEEAKDDGPSSGSAVDSGKMVPVGGGGGGAVSTSRMLMLPKGARIVMPGEMEARRDDERRGRRRAIWDVLSGLAVGAGVLVVVRELLRKYVVPLYFPEASPTGHQGPSTTPSRLSAAPGMEGVKAEVRELRAKRDESEKQIRDLISSLEEKVGQLERKLVETQATSAAPKPVVFRPPTQSKDTLIPTSSPTSFEPDDFMKISPASVDWRSSNEVQPQTPTTDPAPHPPMDERRKSFQEAMMNEARMVLQHSSPKKPSQNESKSGTGSNTPPTGLLGALEPKPN